MPFPSLFLAAAATVILAAPGSFAQAPAPVTAAAPKMQLAAAPPAATGEFTQGSIQVADLLSSLARYDQEGRPKGHKIEFEVPERAINEYLAYSLRNRPRPGITSVTVTLLPKNDLTANVEVDFGALGANLIPEAMRALLSGKQTVTVKAHFEASGGNLTFTLKDAAGPDGKMLAGKLVNDLLGAIGGRQPESYDPSKPFKLPFGLKKVWTEKQSFLGET
jgi:hypothetical protein